MKSLRTCSIVGCSDQHFGLGYCNKHYRRNAKYGTPEPSKELKKQFNKASARPKVPCTYCSELAGPSGLCKLHMKRKRMGRDMTMPRKINNVGNPGYTAVHDNLRKVRGPAKEHVCNSCGNQAMDWTLNSNADIKYQASGPLAGKMFSHNVFDYTALCRPCHIAHDNLNGLHVAPHGRPRKNNP